MNFLTNKRPIIECHIGGKPAAFLLDTGASIAFIDPSYIREYKLIKGKKYHGTVIGAGGSLKDIYYCDSLVDLPNGKIIGQFLLSNISEVINSIKQETGITIVGIISWPQMKFGGVELKYK